MAYSGWNSKFVSNLSRLDNTAQEEYEDGNELISKVLVQ